MLQHLSKNAREVIGAAQQLAQAESGEYMGTEHLLLAICQQNHGASGYLFQNQDVSYEDLLMQFSMINHDICEETWVVTGRLKGTPHFKSVFTNAIEQAQFTKHPQIESAHFMLAILRENGCKAQVALNYFGVTSEMVRQAIEQFAMAPAVE